MAPLLATTHAKMRVATILLILGAGRVTAFVSHHLARAGADINGCTSRHTVLDHSDGTDLSSTRRSFAEDLLKGTVGILAVNLPSPAGASGGATAGGAYLLSAKQRYNDRVLAGIKSFLKLDAADLGQVNAYFESTSEGGWEDFSAAGYLLSNAFRTSSTKPPDSLPSVKKWKSFAKDMELVKRALSKKDSKKVATAIADAEEKLDAYLDAVELPSVMELKQM